MSLETLEQDILAQVSAASDEAAIEAVRVAALGKKGAISERMKTLGSMSPDERREAGAALNLLKDRVSEALGVRKAALQEAALEARLAAEKIDVT
ncbi:MAG: phenylalanine--tRNA ligase subunit alpha, partial [Aestuariivirga sp.]